ncbi:MAG: SusD/RagB family nutrient-binding outer membrane lipoprotein [Flavobacteriales bacterium]|nr:SusD/RagB family nutrient-binding outer membrane lipoprotein [Flavobacteriales bacterium]
MRAKISNEPKAIMLLTTCCSLLKRRVMLLTICCLLLFNACKLEELNENPNVPTDVTMNLLLPSAQSDFANALAGRFFRYSCIASQQLQGQDNQELLMENYNPDELFVGYPWEDFYSGPMINLKLIIEKADEQNSPAYSAIAKIMMANCIGVITDTWGDVPFTEALEGGDNLYPKYDSQEDIYSGIQSILDEAIAQLDEESPIAPGADDLIYGGDLSQWKKAAHALKARYYIHTIHRNSNAAQLALDQLSESFVTFNDDCAYHYLGTATDANPINDFFVSTTYAVIDPQFIGVMGVTDPRFEYFVDIIPFTGGQSKVGMFKGSGNSPLDFISYTEQKFIEAEALLRMDDMSGAATALQQAVQSSFDEVESFLLIDLDDNDVNDVVSSLLLSGNIESDLELIMEQKYVALFTQHECWNDWRRTSFPQLEPNDNGNSSSNPTGEIPRRLIYPQSERILNPNFPGSVDMQARVWWDE